MRVWFLLFYVLEQNKLWEGWCFGFVLQNLDKFLSPDFKKKKKSFLMFQSIPESKVKLLAWQLMPEENGVMQ